MKMKKHLRSFRPAADDERLLTCGRREVSRTLGAVTDRWIANLLAGSDAWRLVELRNDYGRRSCLSAGNPAYRALMREVDAHDLALEWAEDVEDAPLDENLDGRGGAAGARAPEDPAQSGSRAAELLARARREARASPRVWVPQRSFEETCDSAFAWMNAARAALGLGALEEPPEELTALRAALAADRRPFLERVEGPFGRNLAAVARAFALGEDEVETLAFLICVERDADLRAVANLFDYGKCGGALIREVLSTAFGREVPEDVADVSGRLCRIGLLMPAQFSADPPDDLEDWFRPFDAEVDMRAFFERELTVGEIFSKTFSICGPGTLGLGDFAHLSQSVEMLVQYLRAVLARPRPGVNVLLYGPPGTGKTELTRAAAAAVGATLHEVSPGNRHGEGDTTPRLARWALAGELLSKTPGALLVLDEAEDVFRAGLEVRRGGFLDRGSERRQNKAALNTMLEASPVPTFWITNSLAGLDPAYARRFDMVLEIPVPPPDVRRRIAARALEGLVSGELLDRIAAAEGAAPAVVTRAAEALRRLELQTEKARDDAAASLINGTLRVQGLRGLPKSAATLPAVYDAAFVNADADLGTVRDGLARAGRGRLCLYGPPGTGKSACVRWLARELGRPLVLKRASDLLDRYVGGTEENIAGAFCEAEEAGAVLLIDEADSFLLDRSGNSHSWETTAVNEMLTQIEAFDGIFCATTNLVETLDRAALRRFDLKVKFDYLAPAQAQALARRHLEALGLPAPSDPDGFARRIGRLERLTPGDFDAVLRCSLMKPVRTAEELISRLEEECALKTAGRSARRIGF